MKKIFLLLSLWVCFIGSDAQLLGNNVLVNTKRTQYPLGSLPYFWLDATSPNYYTSSNDNIGRIVDSGVGREGTFSISSVSGLTEKPSYNGEGWYFNGVNAVKVGAAADWNGFHNGNNFTIYFSWKQLAMSSTYVSFLACTNNGTATQIGFSIGVDNRSAQSRTNAIVVSITKGINGQPPISVATNNAVIPNAYNWGKITYDGTNVRVYTNGSLRSTTAPGFAFVATNATNTLFVGANSSTGVGSSMYLKHAMFFTSMLSAGDQTLLDSWITAENTYTVTPPPVNVIIIAGQSNAVGHGVNGSISAELSDRVGSYIYKLYSTTPTSNSHWDETQLAVNNQIATGTITEHGIEMRFMYEMHQLNPWKNFLIKFAIGGTALAANADAAGDWNVSSTGELYDKLRINVISNAFREMEHVMRKVPQVRGFIWIQGESDCVSGRGASYKTNFTAMFNGVVDYINTTLGYPTPNLRLFIFRTKNGGSAGYDPTDYANVVAAQTDIGSNYLTDNPSYASKVKGTFSVSTDARTLIDTQHYDTSSLNGMALDDAVAYFAQYINE